MNWREGTAYKIFAIVSNIPDWTPPEIVAWYNARCGQGEALNSVLKSDLAGGQLPSNKFGANAAWWALRDHQSCGVSDDPQWARSSVGGESADPLASQRPSAPRCEQNKAAETQK